MRYYTYRKDVPLAIGKRLSFAAGKGYYVTDAPGGAGGPRMPLGQIGELRPGSAPLGGKKIGSDNFGGGAMPSPAQIALFRKHFHRRGPKPV